MNPAHESAKPAQVWLPLLREMLASKGSFRWPLHGTSMLPTLPAACEIEIEPLPADVRTGDLIVFVSGDALVAHRLVRRTGGHWITQGDGRLVADSPLDPALALGRVSGAFHRGERCWPRKLTWLAGPFWVARYYLLRPARFGWHALRALRRLSSIGRRPLG
jgi:hypothetical protein